MYRDVRLSSTGWLFGFRSAMKFLPLNKLHCSDRSQEKYAGNSQGMNRYPSHRKNRVGNGLIGSIGSHNLASLRKVVNLLLTLIAV